MSKLLHLKDERLWQREEAYVISNMLVRVIVMPIYMASYMMASYKHDHHAF
jgi:hypothetical protein